MKLLDFLSISQKIAILLFFFIISIGYIVITFQHNSQQEQTTLHIELAQQQRLIAEQFTHALLVSRQRTYLTGRKYKSDAVRTTSSLFLNNINLLLEGGKQPTYSAAAPNVKMVAITHNDIRDKIKVSQLHWQKMKDYSRSRYFISTEEVTMFERLQEKLQQQLTLLVSSLKQLESKQLQQQERKLKITATIIILLGIFIAWLITRNITKPLNNIAQTSKRIRLGDLTYHPLKNNHHDELGTLIYQSDEMRSRISELLNNIQQHTKQITYSSLQINEHSEKTVQHKSNQNSSFHALFMQFNKLKEQYDNHFEQYNQQVKHLHKEQEKVANCLTSVALNIKKSEDTKSVNCNVNEQLTQVLATVQQALTLLSTIENMVDNTETLAQKTTISAVQSEQKMSQFVLGINHLCSQSKKTKENIVDLTQLFNKLNDEIKAVQQASNSIDQQLNHSHQQEAEATLLIESLQQEMVLNQQTFESLLIQDIPYKLQLESCQKMGRDLFTSTQQLNQQTDNNALYALGLNKEATLLQALLQTFQLDAQKIHARKGNDKRLHPRINNQMSVALQQNDVCLEGVTENFSLSGLLLKSKRSIEFNPDSPVTTTITLPSSDTSKKTEVITLESNIIRTEQKEGTLYYSINFQTMDDPAAEQVKLIFEYFEKPPEFRT